MRCLTRCGLVSNEDNVVFARLLTGEAAAVREPTPEFRIDPELVYEDAPLPREVPDPIVAGRHKEDHTKTRTSCRARCSQSNPWKGRRGVRVFEHERKRLSMLGRQDLADDVRWVARDDGDGFGFDILSFRRNRQRLTRQIASAGWKSKRRTVRRLPPFSLPVTN